MFYETSCLSIALKAGLLFNRLQSQEKKSLEKENTKLNFGSPLNLFRCYKLSSWDDYNLVMQ